MAVTTADKRATFRKMHETGCFVLPNPWDAGSARALQHLGFKAIASTSAGFAWSIGKADNRVTLEDVLQHLTALCEATDLPVNADFEGGFAHEAAEGRRSTSHARSRPASPDCRSRIPPAMRQIRCTTPSWRSSASRRRAPPSMPTTAACC